MIRSRNDGKLLRRLMIGAVALTVPVLAGCEAGNNSPVLEFHPAANGAYGSAGKVSIIDSFVLGGPDDKPLPQGGSASFFLGMFNSSKSPDKLVSVSAPGVANSVQITGGSVALPAQQPAYLTGPEPKIVLKKLTSALSSGQTITIDLTFQNSGTVSLPVPVEARTGFYTAYSPPPTSSATPKAKSTKSPSTKTSATATPTPTPTPTTTASPTPSPTT